HLIVLRLHYILSLNCIDLSNLLYFHFYFFFFNDTPTTDIYTLSLHDALPIFLVGRETSRTRLGVRRIWRNPGSSFRNSAAISNRSEEHTSELQSRGHLVCRLLLEKKKKTNVFVITKNNSNEKGINSMSDLGAK